MIAQPLIGLRGRTEIVADVEEIAAVGDGGAGLVSLKFEGIGLAVFKFVNVALGKIAAFKKAGIDILKDHGEPVKIAVVLVGLFCGVVDDAKVDVLKFRSGHSGEIPKAG